MYKSDYIRLNLSSVNDLPNMLIEKSKEFYDIDIFNLKISVRYSDFIPNCHHCPINGVTNWGGRIKDAPRHYSGWRGNISFTALCDSNFQKDCLLGTDPAAILFKGFHTGSGNPGKINQHSTNIGFYFFLEDFPLLKKNKEKSALLSSFDKTKVWESIFLEYPA